MRGSTLTADEVIGVPPSPPAPPLAPPSPPPPPPPPAPPPPPPSPAPPCTVEMLKQRPAGDKSWPIKCNGVTLGTAGKQLVLSGEHLSYGEFDDATFIGASAINLEGTGLAHANLHGAKLTADSLAQNFNEGANTASSNCAYGGCTDSVRPNYDSSATFDDGLCAPLFPGCTNSRSGNYEPVYNQDDGSCRIQGCMDTISIFFDPEATYDGTLTLSEENAYYECACSGTCPPAGSGRRLSGEAPCWDPKAINYQPGSFGDWGCVYAVKGCTDSEASNYKAIFNTDDGSCTFPVFGCTDAAAINFNSTATVNEGCVYTLSGCTDSVSTNYNSDANTDDGNCKYNIYGCADVNALNFDSVATVSFNCTARIEGCTVSSAKNFAADANVATNNECIYVIPGCMTPEADNFDSLATEDDGSCVVSSPPTSPPRHPMLNLILKLINVSLMMAQC